MIAQYPLRDALTMDALYRALAFTGFDQWIMRPRFLIAKLTIEIFLHIFIDNMFCPKFLKFILHSNDIIAS